MVGELPRLGFRVLVVDDSPDNALSWQMLLRIYGFDTDVAFSGESALLLAEKSPPRVALLDLSMPRMDGFALARQLRKMFGSRIRLIAVTAHGYEEDQQRCLREGFDYHFTKPADPTAVARSLVQIATRSA